MEGRWTVRVDAYGAYVRPHPDAEASDDAEVPVVPCDDAAIDFAAAQACGEHGRGCPDFARSRERIVRVVEDLRAAGETPERKVDSDLGWPACGCEAREGCWCAPDPRTAGEAP